MCLGRDAVCLKCGVQRSSSLAYRSRDYALIVVLMDMLFLEG